MSEPSLVTSRSNPLIKLARSLRERKERNRTRLFVAEGILHVGEAVAAGWQIEAILYSPERLESDFARELVAAQSARGVRCQPVAADVFEALAGKDNPPGLLAIVQQKSWPLQDLSPTTFRLGAAVVAPQDPGNVGTILRTLDAMGGDGLILIDATEGEGSGVDAFHPTAVRASMGTIFWKPVAQSTFAEFISWARARGYRLIGSSAHAAADYRSLQANEAPAILLLGGEQKGLGAEQLAACDFAVKLPMRGRASSLNLAVAAGILLYALKP